MSFSGRVCAFAVLAMGMLPFVTGCGETLIDASKTEGLIEIEMPNILSSASGKKLAKQLGISADEKISSVACPSGQEVDPGATFSCSVTFAKGAKASVKLEITDKDANLGVVEATPIESHE